MICYPTGRDQKPICTTSKGTISETGSNLVLEGKKGRERRLRILSPVRTSASKSYKREGRKEGKEETEGKAVHGKRVRKSRLTSSDSLI